MERRAFKHITGRDAFKVTQPVQFKWKWCIMFGTLCFLLHLFMTENNMEMQIYPKMLPIRPSSSKWRLVDQDFTCTTSTHFTNGNTCKSQSHLVELSNIILQSSNTVLSYWHRKGTPGVAAHHSAQFVQASDNVFFLVTTTNLSSLWALFSEDAYVKKTLWWESLKMDVEKSDYCLAWLLQFKTEARNTSNCSGTMW